MKRDILIVYSTIDGHTLEICERIRALLQGDGHAVDLLPVAQVLADPEGAALARRETIVIGASIRYGKHNRQVYDFVRRHGRLLDGRRNAFFSVNAVARKPGKRTPDTNPYVRKFLRQIDWQPQHVEIFGGKIDYQKYDFFDRNIIRFIMWMTKGPTDPKSVIDFTDWQQVDAFARRIGE